MLGMQITPTPYTKPNIQLPTTYVHLNIIIWLHIHTHVHQSHCLPAHKNTHMYRYMLVHAHTHTHTHTHTHIHTYTQNQQVIRITLSYYLTQSDVGKANWSTISARRNSASRGQGGYDPHDLPICLHNSQTTSIAYRQDIGGRRVEGTLGTLYCWTTVSIILHLCAFSW